METIRFNSLSISNKIARVLKYGKPLSARVKSGFIIILYSINGTFVELWQRYGVKNGDVVALLSFTHTQGLRSYKKLDPTI